MESFTNDEEYSKVKEELASGIPLNLRHLYRVFGPSAYELFIVGMGVAKIDKVNKIVFEGVK